MSTWRPLRHSLSDEAIQVMDAQRAAGETPMPIHMMLVYGDGPNERGKVACGGGLGEWVTGDITQVTCDGCKEQVHA